MAIAILETARTRLQVPELSDLHYLVELRTDPDVMRCIGGMGQAFGTGVIQEIEEIEYQLSLTQDYYDQYGFGFFCVFEKTTHAFLGQAGLFHLSFNTSQPLIELAYRFHQRYWGKGYATECANALIQWGLHEKGLSKIIAPVHPGNARSIGVLEKTKMSYSGTMEYKGHPIPYYSIEQSNDDRN
jgi:[ribosomal protein S5]-alanine N-acetyltransferase